MNQPSAKFAITFTHIHITNKTSKAVNPQALRPKTRISLPSRNQAKHFSAFELRNAIGPRFCPPQRRMPLKLDECASNSGPQFPIELSIDLRAPTWCENMIPSPISPTLRMPATNHRTNRRSVENLAASTAKKEIYADEVGKPEAMRESLRRAWSIAESRDGKAFFLGKPGFAYYVFHSSSISIIRPYREVLSDEFLSDVG